MTGRGAVTPAIQAKAKQLLGLDELTKAEFRLMPYVQYVMVNEQKIKPQLVNAEEREILQQWRERGWIEGGMSGLAITREFWDAILELIWMGYVAYDADYIPENHLEIENRKLRELVEALVENDPDDLVADGGHTVLDLWRHDAKKILNSN